MYKRQVTKAPPSIGQCLIKGILSIVVSLHNTGFNRGFFNGKADKAVKETLAYLKGFLSALTGLFFISIKV